MRRAIAVVVISGAGVATAAGAQEASPPGVPAALRPPALRPAAPAALGGSGAIPAPGALAVRAGIRLEPADLPAPAHGADPRGLLASPAGAFTSSLVLPGSGQAALGLRRWPLYLVAEAGLWWLRIDSRGDFVAYRTAYRDLAWEAARLSEGPRREGSWSYYETMSQFLESGLFDRDPAEGLQPELDPATYNGYVWQLARSIYLPGGEADASSPEYRLALEWYAGRAAGPDFLWSWTGKEAELERFRALIGSADGASRAARRAAGAILANHLVSAVDALVVARLRSGAGPSLHGRLLVAPGEPTWELGLRIPLTH